MGALVTCAGGDVIAARIHMPIRGAWWADVKLDLSTPPTGQVILAAQNGLSLVGTIIRAGVFLAQTQAKLVGGAGGLAVMVPAQAWRGAQLGDPLNAVMSASGEKLSSTIASSVLAVSLPAWSFASMHAGQALDELCAAAAAQLGQTINWRALSDGTIWLGAETWPSE